MHEVVSVAGAMDVVTNALDELLVDES